MYTKKQKKQTTKTQHKVGITNEMIKLVTLFYSIECIFRNMYIIKGCNLSWKASAVELKKATAVLQKYKVLYI